MNTKDILAQITKEQASDIFIVAGRPLTYKVNGCMRTLNDDRLMPEMCQQFVTDIYQLAGNRDMTHFEETGDDDFSFAIPGVSRFRVSTYKQRGSFSAVIRIISFVLPHWDMLNIPETVMNLADIHNGMVLVTGP